jgi:hypothetical protein
VTDAEKLARLVRRFTAIRHNESDGTFDVSFTTGAQSFNVAAGCETREDADWFVTQLCTALTSVIESAALHGFPNAHPLPLSAAGSGAVDPPYLEAEPEPPAPYEYDRSLHHALPQDQCIGLPPHEACWLISDDGAVGWWGTSERDGRSRTFFRWQSGEPNPNRENER